MKKLFTNKTYKKHRDALIIGIDMCLVLFSVLAAIFLKLDFDFKNYVGYGYKNFIIYFIAVLVVYFISFEIFGVNRSLWSYIGMREAAVMALSVVAASFVIILGIILTSSKMFLVSITIIAGLMSISLMLNVRVIYRLFAQKKDASTVKNALIVGAGDGGYLMLKELEQNPKYKAKVIGFVDDAKHKKIVSGKNVLGDTYQIPKLIEKYNIKVIYIAIPSASKADIKRIVALCQSSSEVEIKIMQKEDNRILDNKTVESYPVKPVSIADLLERGEVNLNVEEILSYIGGKVVLVTGAGGSIGSEICRQIARFAPKKLVMLDIYENNLYDLEQELKRRKGQGLISEETELITVIASVRDIEALKSIFEKYSPNAVYHAAAHKHVPLMETAPLEAIKNNVFGTKNVAECALEYGAERFILISTDKAVNPTNVMGATKRMAELIMQSRARSSRNKGTRMAAVRFGNVLGSNGSVVPLFARQIAEGGPVTLTHRDIERFFMTIPEAAQLVLQAGYYAKGGEIYILDMGQPVRILELAEKMIRLSGYVPYEDIDIVEIGLRPGEKMYEELNLPDERMYKTDNSLINVCEPIGLTEEVVDEKLVQLWQRVQQKDADLAKETLFDVIKKDKESV